MRETQESNHKFGLKKAFYWVRTGINAAPNLVFALVGSGSIYPRIFAFYFLSPKLVSHQNVFSICTSNTFLIFMQTDRNFNKRSPMRGQENFLLDLNNAKTVNNITTNLTYGYYYWNLEKNIFFIIIQEFCLYLGTMFWQFFRICYTRVSNYINNCRLRVT